MLRNKEDFIYLSRNRKGIAIKYANDTELDSKEFVFSENLAKITSFSPYIEEAILYFQNKNIIKSDFSTITYCFINKNEIIKKINNGSNRFVLLDHMIIDNENILIKVKINFFKNKTSTIMKELKVLEELNSFFSIDMFLDNNMIKPDCLHSFLNLDRLFNAKNEDIIFLIFQYCCLRHYCFVSKKDSIDIINRILNKSI